MRKFLVVLSALALLVNVPRLAFANDGLLDDSVILGSSSNEIEIEVEHMAENEAGDDHGNDAMKTNVEIVAGTNLALSSAVDSLITKMEGVSSADFCSKISGAVASLSATEKSSLAWRADSYIGNLKFDASENASEKEKSEYDSLRDSYEKISKSLTDDGNITSSDKAAIRGSLMVLMNAYREGKVDSATEAKIKAFLEKSAVCLSDGASVKMAISANGEVSAPAPLSITRKDISEDDHTQEVPKAETVKSEDSLKTFITANIANDANVKSVKTDSSQTETVYKQKGKFLGFIPVKMNVRATVKADGSASIHYPWYKFLTSAVGGKVTSETVLGNLEISGDTELSKTDQANIVSAVMKTFADLSVSSETEMNSDTEMNSEMESNTETEMEAQ